MAAIIDVSDLPDSLQSADMILAMVTGANARASRVAPCLAGTGADAPTVDQPAEARLVLLGAVKRWAEAGAGSFQSQTAGPFGVTMDTRQRTGFNLWPSEVTALQQICASGPVGREAFSIDTAPASGLANHSPICDLFFGGATCSCGANLTNGEYPLYEV